MGVRRRRRARQPATRRRRSTRRRAAKASADLIDVLADLHAVDVDAVGLGDLARRDGYIERQLKRWTTQWKNSKTRELPAIDEVARRLAERMPEQQGVVDRPRRLPLRQLPHRSRRRPDRRRPRLGAVHARRSARRRRLPRRLLDRSRRGRRAAQRPVGRSRGSRPTPSSLERYAARTGRDLTGIDYYVAFSSWRLAVISEGVYARYLHGAMGDQGLEPGRARRHAWWHRDAGCRRIGGGAPARLTAPRCRRRHTLVGYQL